jgi:hypothetical protein
MARLNHDVLATEVRYTLTDLTMMSMAELETLAHLLACPRLRLTGTAPRARPGAVRRWWTADHEFRSAGIPPAAEAQLWR